MKISLIIVTASLVFLLLFSSFIFLLIVLRRLYKQYTEAKLTEQAQKVEKDILQAITSNNRDICLEVSRKHQANPKILLKVLITFVETFQGQERDLLRFIFDNSLKERLTKQIYSRTTLRRLRAARPLVLFSGPQDGAHIMKLLTDKPVISLAAINALSRIPNTYALTYIFKAFEADPDPNQRAYLNVLYGLGDKIQSLIQQYIGKTLSLPKLCLLLELVGSIPLPKLYQDVIKFRQHEDKEVRIRVARVLGGLNVPLPEVIDALIKLTMDEAWEVKAQSLKSLGILKSEEALDVLATALFSPNWYCRLNAGNALAGMGKPGIRRLKEIAIQKADRYASEMAKMILEDTYYFK